MRFFIIVIILGMYLADGTAQTTPPAPSDSIIAPNVFTPNGDGVNDIFEVRSREGNKVSLKVYTRTGILVFAIDAERCRWDGHSLSGVKMPTGIYYYTADVIHPSIKESKSGIVHLYR